mmetsp:Transcript_15492/g.30434  ORF Transcript_15492/g.30434 Transcript_15492/m.30434 type:complete len:323 (+) Transcript_15492:35-1003(+)
MTQYGNMNARVNDIAGNIDLDGDEDRDEGDEQEVTATSGLQADSAHAEEDPVRVSKTLRLITSRSKLNLVLARLNIFTFYGFGVFSAFLTIVVHWWYSCPEGFAFLNVNGIGCMPAKPDVAARHHSLNTWFIGFLVAPLLYQLCVLYATCGVYVYASRTAENREDTTPPSVCANWLQASSMMGDPANMFASISVFCAIRAGGHVSLLKHPGVYCCVMSFAESVLSLYHCTFFIKFGSNLWVVLKVVMSLWQLLFLSRLGYFLTVKYRRFALKVPPSVTEGFFYAVIKSFSFQSTVSFFESLAEREWMYSHVQDPDTQEGAGA